MKAEWPARPIIYEINTWVWLNDLSSQCKRTITLGTVPLQEWDAIAALGVDAVWPVSYTHLTLPTNREV